MTLLQHTAVLDQVLSQPDASLATTEQVDINIAKEHLNEEIQTTTKNPLTTNTATELINRLDFPYGVCEPTEWGTPMVIHNIIIVLKYSRLPLLIFLSWSKFTVRLRRKALDSLMQEKGGLLQTVKEKRELTLRVKPTLEALRYVKHVFARGDYYPGSRRTLLHVNQALGLLTFVYSVNSIINEIRNVIHGICLVEYSQFFMK